MIVKFRVVRKDTKAAIQGAKIVLEHGETDGITNSAGEAEIIIFWSGNMMYSVEAVGYSKVSGTVQVPGSGSITLTVELGAFAVPVTPPTSGEESVRRIQNSCTLVRSYMVGSMWYNIRHDQRGLLTAWNRDWEYVARQDQVVTWCAEIAPPPPKSADDVAKDVDILRSALQSLTGPISALTQAIDDIRTAIAAMFDSLSSRIQSVETKVAAIKLPDIEGLKLWIEEQIIAILLRALDREVKGMK